MRSKYIDAGEVKAIRAELSEEAWLPLWVALETGLRVGDVVKLRRVNLKADGLHYKAQKTRKNGVARISGQLRKILATRRGKWFFPSPYKAGKHITRQCVWARIKRACERGQLPPEGISPHSLRKVFAVELYREKGFRAVQEALQHANCATTEIYSFADWSTGECAELPLKRKDLQLIVKLVLESLGDVGALSKQPSKKRAPATPSEKEAHARERKSMLAKDSANIDFD